MLDVVDFGHNVHAAEFGEYGLCRVRYGKAKKGSPPKQRSVLTVWAWTPEVLEEWFTGHCCVWGWVWGSKSRPTPLDLVICVFSSRGMIVRRGVVFALSDPPAPAESVDVVGPLVGV